MADTLSTAWRVLARRKTSVCPGDGGQSTRRSLSLVDVTCLGLATTLGTGVYTLVTQSAREFAGPSVVLSILIASVTSCLGGLCYSEVATRFPRGGSAYAYVYATTGELFAFLVGWMMVLEYSLGTALGAKTCSQYLDIVTNGTLTRALGQPFGQMNVPGLDKYLDLPSVVITIAVSLLLAWTIKLSCSVNNALVIINLLVICGMVLVGIFNMDSENWTAGSGFFPSGVSGVFSAASLCYFSFVGYDIMAMSSGEATHRSHVLPTAVSLMFLIGLLATFTTAASITLLVPFSLLDFKGPLLQAFIMRGVAGMEYFVAIGAISGLLSATAAAVFAQARLLQNLAADGLLFRFLTRDRHLLTGRAGGCGYAATLSSCVLSSALSLLCDGRTLVHVLGMGTLISCTAVAISVLCLRYGVSERLPLETGELSRESTASLSGQRHNGFGIGLMDAQTQTGSVSANPKDLVANHRAKNVEEHLTLPSSGMLDESTAVNSSANENRRDYGSLSSRTMSVDFVNDSFITCLSELSPHWNKQEPSPKSSATAAGLVGAMIVIMLLMGVMTLHVPKLVTGSRWWMELVACALFVAVVVCVTLMCRQPRHRPRLHNRVPCVPLLPLCSIWMDVHLMVGLPYTAWLVALVWTLLGILVYLGYGVWNSTERHLDDTQDVTLLDVTDDADERDQEFTQREMLVEAC